MTMAIPHCELFRLAATFSCLLKSMMSFPGFPLTVTGLSHRLEVSLLIVTATKASADAHGVKGKQAMAVKVQCYGLPSPSGCV